MESKFKKRETFDRFLIRFDHKNFFKRWLMVLDLFYEITICSFVIIIIQNMVLVCEMYFHTLCQINEDTTQCKIVVTVVKRKSSHGSDGLACVNLTSFLGSLKDSGEKHEGFAG